MVVSKSEYARMLGITRQAVNNQVKSGRLRPTTEGLIDTESSVIKKLNKQKKTESQKTRIGGNGFGDEMIEIKDIRSLQKAKLIAETERIRMDTEAKRLSYLIAEKKLIEWGLAEWLFFSHLRKINQNILNLPGVLRVAITNLVTEGKVEELIRMLEDELSVILTEGKKGQAESLANWEDEGS